MPWSDRGHGDDYGRDPGDEDDRDAEDNARRYQADGNDPFAGLPPSPNPAFRPILPPAVPPVVPPASVEPPARKRPAELDDRARRECVGRYGTYAEGTDPWAIRLHEEILDSQTAYARTLKWRRIA